MRKLYKIAVGIPTYNRRYFVEANARSLARVKIPDFCDVQIVVADDASTEYDAAYLASIYPENTIVERRSVNSGGADYAIFDLARRCLELNADAILILDSDLVMSKNLIERGLPLLSETHGCVSLFNTSNHPIAEVLGALVVKETVGSAGTLWKRELAQEIVDNVPAGPSWDWRYSEYINKTGRKIYVSSASLVQHIGCWNGQNSSVFSGDYGAGFCDEGPENAYVILEAATAAISALGNKVKELETKLIEQERWIRILEKNSEQANARNLLFRLRRKWKHLMGVS